MTGTARAEGDDDRVAVVLFVRAPTRERKTLGLAADARALAASLARTVDVARSGVRSGLRSGMHGAALVLVADGDVGVDGAIVIPQRGETFEERLLCALTDTAALGFTRLVAIGGDTPALDASDLERALNARDVVIGPARDGGFYLLSIPSSDVPTLRGLPYCTGGLLPALTARFASRRVTMLAAKIDVDDAASARAVLPLLERACRRYFGVGLATVPQVWDGRDVAVVDVGWPAAPGTGPPARAG